MSNIIRVKKRDKFTIINRDLLEDSRLHWSTRGILGYLLCKQDDWELRIKDLKNQGDLGRDALYKRINNAIECGYITRIQERDELGRRGKTIYIVHEESTKPLPENQDADKQEAENQDREKQEHTKDLVLINTKKTTTTENVVGRQFIFHKNLLNSQKQEIEKLLKDIDKDTAQDVLYELSGYIDSGLIKKDEVSLVYGFVRKVQKGEFNLRVGIKYKESSRRTQALARMHQKTEEVKESAEVNMNNKLVKKVLSIRDKRSKSR